MSTIIKPARVAVLVKGGMVVEVRSSVLTMDVEVVDADFICCNPEEKWNTLKQDIPFIVFKSSAGTVDNGGVA